MASNPQRSNEMALIRGGRVFSPQNVGVRDILLASGSIAAVAEPPSISVSGLEIEIIEASGKTVIPGFVDNHVHIVMMDAMDATLRNASF